MSADYRGLRGSANRTLHMQIDFRHWLPASRRTATDPLATYGLVDSSPEGCQSETSWSNDECSSAIGVDPQVGPGKTEVRRNA